MKESDTVKLICKRPFLCVPILSHSNVSEAKLWMSHVKNNYRNLGSDEMLSLFD